ncbi:VOC family protein [Luteipulveratus mongoliensis]|uniref:VOC domain-containing protein n=1 Tax=Luteipulveratus mongoliensis TaxID=571913 RepID=A0A0K1JPD9_9MICO|nr:VOC family protein [Luteipulveratus mongoliensis]AKU18430.1 hypothetical protein VV02_25555 [Luteipulveratus mongoliensis]
MGTRDTAWPAGTPCWVDCGFEHVDKARKFYGHLFGWDMEPGPAETGGYTMCLKNGRPAAAISESQDEDVPTFWATYLATDDVDATTTAVREAGGQVVVETLDIPGSGRMAIYQDPTGAQFSVWQADGHTGMQIYHEPGTVAWNDLMTRDLPTAMDFYAKVFGYTYEDAGDGYQVVKLGDGTTVAGMHQAEHLPDDAPSTWLVHFAVADRDSTVSLAEMEDNIDVLLTFDTPFGPEATLRGPEGEIFNVISSNDDDN